MLYQRLAVIRAHHTAALGALGALGVIALTSICACGPIGAGSAAAADLAASAVRETRIDAADEHGLVTRRIHTGGPVGDDPPGRP